MPRRNVPIGRGKANLRQATVRPAVWYDVCQQAARAAAGVASSLRLLAKYGERHLAFGRYASGWRASFARGGSPGSADVERTPGHVDGNGSVDLLDLTVVQRSLGVASGATQALGDLNGDGAVNRADVALLAMSFGRQASAESPSASPSAAAVVTAAPWGGELTRRAGAVHAVRRPMRATLPTAEVDQAIASGLHAPAMRRVTIVEGRGARRLRTAT
jgi:hypothetical protein